MRKTRKPIHPVPGMKKIGVSALQGISVLFENDLYELALWLLKLQKAKRPKINFDMLYTVYGLACKYATCGYVDLSLVVSVIERHGLQMNATIEYDEELK
jgi:hypothetical protein